MVRSTLNQFLSLINFKIIKKKFPKAIYSCTFARYWKDFQKIFNLNSLVYKTISANAATVNKNWVVIDIKDIPLGRACSIIANFLRGKYKSNYTPHVDCGDNVIVLNAAKIKLTGNKWEKKKYIRHTGYPGGQRVLNPIQIHNRNNTRLVEKSVRGMLPKNKLGASLFRNLRVYGDENHKQDSQNPKIINLKDYL